jgi:hypothetical protein
MRAAARSRFIGQLSRAAIAAITSKIFAIRSQRCQWANYGAIIKRAIYQAMAKRLTGRRSVI